jgi:hypothetical protein
MNHMTWNNALDRRYEKSFLQPLMPLGMTGSSQSVSRHLSVMMDYSAVLLMRNSTTSLMTVESYARVTVFTPMSITEEWHGLLIK